MTTKEKVKNAMKLYEQGNVDQAYNVFSQLIRIEPEDAMAHAIAYIGRGLSGVLIEDSMHDFIGDFKKAITLYPDIEEIFQYHLESPNHNLLIIDILRQGFIESTLVRIIKQFCDYKETKLAVHQ